MPQRRTLPRGRVQPCPPPSCAACPSLSGPRYALLRCERGGPGGERWGVLIEYDRTERPHKQIDRLRRYDWWLLEGWRETHFATHPVAPSVIYLTARSQPLRALIRAADRTFSAWHGRRDAGPREGVHPARQGVMFASRERVLSGDWTMECAPSLPPVLREHPNVCSPDSLVYDLPASFGRRGERAQVA